MNRMIFCVLLFGLAAASVLADDEKKPTGQPAKAPDWSKWAKGDPVEGQVGKASEKSITLTYKVRKGNRTVNEEIDYEWNEQGLARREKPPTFFDDKGLPRRATAAELERLKKPAGVPGYAIERTDIKPGDLVKLELVRPSSISATKAKREDYSIKYAIVKGDPAKPVRDNPGKN